MDSSSLDVLKNLVLIKKSVLYYISVPRKVQELYVNIGFLDKNKRNETTFNWGPGMNIIFIGNTHRIKHVRNNCCSHEKIP